MRPWLARPAWRTIVLQLRLWNVADGLQKRGYGSVPVVQAYQPTEQGVSTNATVYYYVVSNYRYGYNGVSVSPDNPEPEEMDLIETQYYETTFQISGLVISSPTNTNVYTVFDLVTAQPEILASEYSVTTLQAAGVGILRIIPIRSPNFKDDRQEFEQSPNFDFVLMYKNVNISAIPVIKRVELDVYRVS